MNSGVPKPKVLRAADENAPHDLDGIVASPNSYFQLLLKKCRSRGALLPASGRGQTDKGAAGGRTEGG